VRQTVIREGVIASQGRHRIEWVVYIGCRLLVTGELERQPAQPGTILTMKKILGELSPCQRPFVLMPPSIGSHDKNRNWRLTRHSIVDSFDDIVEPSDGQRYFVFDSRFPEIPISRWPIEMIRSIYDDPQLLRWIQFLEFLKVRQRGARIVVVPSGHEIDGNPNFVVFLSNADFAPEVVVLRVGEIVAP
jgi:hypothetical protein